MRLLVNLATGPENPTRAALALLVARSAVEEGHDVRLFLAGDGVQLARPETAEAARGIGTGSVAEHWEALSSAGVPVFLSGLSSKARGVPADVRRRESSPRRPESSSSWPPGPRRRLVLRARRHVRRARSATTTAHSSRVSIVSGSSRSARSRPAANASSSSSRSVEM